MIVTKLHRHLWREGAKNRERDFRKAIQEAVDDCCRTRYLSEGWGLPPLCWSQIVLRRFHWDAAARRERQDHIGAGAILAIHHQLHRVVLTGGHRPVAADRAEQLLLTGDSRSLSQVKLGEALRASSAIPRPVFQPSSQPSGGLHSDLGLEHLPLFPQACWQSLAADRLALRLPEVLVQSVRPLAHGAHVQPQSVYRSQSRSCSYLLNKQTSALEKIQDNNFYIDHWRLFQLVSTVLLIWVGYLGCASANAWYLLACKQHN